MLVRLSLLIILALPLWGLGLEHKDFEIPERYQYREWSEEERILMGIFFDERWSHSGITDPQVSRFYLEHLEKGKPIAHEVIYIEDLQSRESVIIWGRMAQRLTKFYTSREIIQMLIDNLDKILSVENEEHSYWVRAAGISLVGAYGTSKDFWIIDRLTDESTRSDAEYMKALILKDEAEGKVPTSEWESKQQEAAEAGKNPVLKVITPSLQSGKPNLACYLWTSLVLVTCTGLFLRKRHRAHS